MLKVYKTINNGLKFLNESLVTSHRYIKHKGYVNNISFNKILLEEQNKLNKMQIIVYKLLEKCYNYIINKTN